VNRPLYCKAFDDHQLTLSLIRADAGLTGRFGLARTRDLRWAMCRNITMLRGLEPPATHEEIHAAALQYARKVAAVTSGPLLTASAFTEAVDQIADVTERLLGAFAASSVATIDGSSESTTDVTVGERRVNDSERFGQSVTTLCPAFGVRWPRATSASASIDCWDPLICPNAASDTGSNKLVSELSASTDRVIS